jgi:hypothetical protein
MRRVLWIVCMGFAAVAPLSALASGPGAAAWSVYADCAAAYQVNAAIADPGRPASMTAQVSDVALDYSAAAVKQRRRRSGESPAIAGRIVKARVAARSKALAAMPREAVERIIDACPQVDG